MAKLSHVSRKVTCVVEGVLHGPEPHKSPCIHARWECQSCLTWMWGDFVGGEMLPLWCPMSNDENLEKLPLYRTPKSPHMDARWKYQSCLTCHAKQLCAVEGTQSHLTSTQGENAKLSHMLHEVTLYGGGDTSQSRTPQGGREVGIVTRGTSHLVKFFTPWYYVLALKSKSFAPSFGVDGNSNSIPVNGNLSVTFWSSTEQRPWIGRVDEDIGILMYIVANPSITMIAYLQSTDNYTHRVKKYVQYSLTHLVIKSSYYLSVPWVPAGLEWKQITIVQFCYETHIFFVQN